MRHARAIARLWIVLAVLFVAGTTRAAQSARPAPAPVIASATEHPSAKSDAEEEAADSPRASMRTFLDLCERRRYEEAARFLDVPRGAERRSAELAQKLHDILSERLWIDPEKLSPAAEGRSEDALPAGTEELGRIDDSRGHPLSIRIVRREARSATDEARWVFAQSTVVNVDALHAALRSRWLRDRLPAILLVKGPLALAYWQWIAIPLLAAGCIAIGRILTALSGAVARRTTAAKQPWGPRLIHEMRRPATLGWALALFWLFLPYLALTLRGEEMVTRALSALGYLAFFWALVRAVSLAGDEIARAQWSATRHNMRAVTSVGVRLGKVIVVALAFTVFLSELGYPVTTVVAGLGIGGVALALAAQKTVENLFGSISILADQPFGVGDTIRVDGVEGTVEVIGLRSTRLRTVERTLVIIPNGKLADMRIESLGPRDRIRFSTKLALANRTDVAQIERVVEALRTGLRGHASVVRDDVHVRVSALGEGSFDIEVAAPIETTSASEFARVREELLLMCMRIVSEHGVKLAVPTRQLVAPSDAPTPTASPAR